MESMEKMNLSLPQRKEYVKNIMDLEISNYQQRELIEKLQFKINGIIVSTPKEPLDFSWLVEFFGLAVIIAIAGLIGWFVGMIFSAAASGALIGGGIFGIITLFDIQTHVKERNENQKKIENAKGQISVLNDILANSKNKLEETTEVLNSYYDLNLIYPKYRGVVPIFSICEYLESGRCYTFEGPNGAYNLYEQEVRADLIISKLDEIIERLNDIKEGQQKLACLIRESNEKLDSLSYSIDALVQSCDRIERSTALNTYYNGITAANINYRSWITAWKNDSR